MTVDRPSIDRRSTVDDRRSIVVDRRSTVDDRSTTLNTVTTMSPPCTISEPSYTTFTRVSPLSWHATSANSPMLYTCSEGEVARLIHSTPPSRASHSPSPLYTPTNQAPPHRAPDHQTNGTATTITKRTSAKDGPAGPLPPTATPP
jgi:hypothetical protein